MKQSIDYLLVPGRGLEISGDSVEPTIQTRLNGYFTRELILAELVEQGVIFSGYRQETENIEPLRSEASYMEEIAYSNSGISLPRWLEEQSTTSFENVLYTDALIKKLGIDINGARIGVASSKLHARRVAAIARNAWPDTEIITMERPQSFKDMMMEPALGYLARKSLASVENTGPEAVLEAQDRYRGKVNRVKKSPLRHVHSGL